MAEYKPVSREEFDQFVIKALVEPGVVTESWEEFTRWFPEIGKQFTSHLVVEGITIRTRKPEDNVPYTFEYRPIRVGDTVRSYDFPDSPEDRRELNYAEGVVEAVGRFPYFRDCDRYKIRVTRRVFDGEEKHVNVTEEYVYPPVNGVPTTRGRVTDGVKRID